MARLLPGLSGYKFKVFSAIVHDNGVVMGHNPVMLRNTLIVIVVVVSAQSPITAGAANVHWRVNSLLATQLFGESGRIFAEEVERATDGAFTMEVHDQLVLDVDAFEALRSGLVDAVWGSPGHHHREDPSLTIFGGFPFGPDPAAFTAWMTEGGGSAMLNEMYERHGLRSIYCGALPAEGGGWFRFPVESVTDLDGLSMRAFGYGASTLRTLGVTTYELPASDIRPAYDTGIIDAAEFAMPSIDGELGLDEMAPYLLMPGWQQPATSLELLVLETSWLELPERFREAITHACDAVSRWTLDVALPRQEAALEGFRLKGVKTHQWPEDVLEALELAWAKVVAAEIEDNPKIGSVWQSYLRFSATYAPAGSAADRD
jgi:TRAP-type mannitol/chloroaromatic compound transport system substrate-binding protein